MLTSIPEFEEECHRECHTYGKDEPSDHTGVPHESWTPVVVGGVLQDTKTSLGEEYQPEL